MQRRVNHTLVCHRAVCHSGDEGEDRHACSRQKARAEILVQVRRLCKVPGAHAGLSFMCGVSHRIHVLETRTDGIVFKIIVFTMQTARCGRYE